jgi:hypothetical protein
MGSFVPVTALANNTYIQAVKTLDCIIDVLDFV